MEASVRRFKLESLVMAQNTLAARLTHASRTVAILIGRQLSNMWVSALWPGITRETCANTG